MPVHRKEHEGPCRVPRYRQQKDAAPTAEVEQTLVAEQAERPRTVFVFDLYEQVAAEIRRAIAWGFRTLERIPPRRAGSRPHQEQSTISHALNSFRGRAGRRRITYMVERWLYERAYA
jgi:hypothetical protein